MGALPAREMLGDMLLEMHRREQALVEYEGELKINPAVSIRCMGPREPQKWLRTPARQPITTNNSYQFAPGQVQAARRSFTPENSFPR